MSPSHPGPVPAISAAELAALLGTAGQPLLVDVRTAAEHREQRIPGAVNIPLDELSGQLSALPRDLPFVVHCASGNRSRGAVEVLRLAGYPALDLTGGIAAWARWHDVSGDEQTRGPAPGRPRLVAPGP
jgi:rhodanese-related sulfurtransferase